MVKLCDSRNPFEIARALSVHILPQDNFENLKGMYKVIMRNRFIFINTNIDENMQKIVCAHELGHDQLHRDIAANESLHEFSLYKFDTGIEYEANIFAAEILLDDFDVLECLQNDLSPSQTAQALNSDINLISLKIDSLVLQGHKLRKIGHRTDFLK